MLKKGTNNVAVDARLDAFVSAYIVNGYNATQAAKTAGYSEKTAYSKGQQLLKLIEVRAKIEKLIAKADLSSPKEVLQRIDNMSISAEKDSDKIKCLELLGKYYALFTERKLIEDDPQLRGLRDKIQARAEQQGMTYAEQLDYFLNNYGHSISPEIRQKLATETVQ